MAKHKGLLIGGPTGIGKTDLAEMLALKLGGELISCDSVQVFKELSIGANKTPTSVPQHMIDVVDWKDTYTAADFSRDAYTIIQNVISRGKVPILVGGSGFHLDWMLEGRPSAPPTDPAIAAQIKQELDAMHSWKECLEMLAKVDPIYSKSLNENDYYRLSRALSVYRQTGRPLTEFKQRRPLPISIDWHCVYLTVRDRVAMSHHLDARCESMVKRGLLKEVFDLKAKGLTLDFQAGRSIGYKESLDFLASEMTEAIFLDFINKFQNETRKYTRRQEKWFYGMGDRFAWFERDLNGGVDSICKAIIDAWDNGCSIKGNPGLRAECRDPTHLKTKYSQMRVFRPVLTVFNQKTEIQKMLDSLL